MSVSSAGKVFPCPKSFECEGRNEACTGPWKEEATSGAAGNENGTNTRKEEWNLSKKDTHGGQDVAGAPGQLVRSSKTTLPQHPWSTYSPASASHTVMKGGSGGHGE